MFVARFSVDVRFGHKDDFTLAMKKWQAEVGSKVGWDNQRVLTGSIGAPESRFEMEMQVSSLADLENAWARMVELPHHKVYAKELEQHIVSGSNRWEVFRVVQM